MAARDLVTLAEVTRQLETTGRDDEFNDLIAAATAAIEKHIDNVLIYKQVVEYSTGSGSPASKGGAGQLFLDYYPIVSIASISDLEDIEVAKLSGALTDSNTTINLDDSSRISVNDVLLIGSEEMLVRTVPSATQITVARRHADTAAADHADMDVIYRRNKIDPTEYYIYPDEGAIEYRYGRWPAPVGQWKITYMAGRFMDTATVDPALKQIVIRLLSTWQDQDRTNLTSVRVGPVSETYRDTRSGEGTSGLPQDIENDLSPWMSYSF